MVGEQSVGISILKTWQVCRKPSSLVSWVINWEWMLAKITGTAVLQLELMNNGVLMSCCWKSEWFCSSSSQFREAVSGRASGAFFMFRGETERQTSAGLRSVSWLRACACFHTQLLVSVAAQQHTPTKTVAYILSTGESGDSPTAASTCPSCTLKCSLSYNSMTPKWHLKDGL